MYDGVYCSLDAPLQNLLVLRPCISHHMRVQRPLRRRLPPHPEPNHPKHIHRRSKQKPVSQTTRILSTSITHKHQQIAYVLAPAPTALPSPPAIHPAAIPAPHRLRDRSSLGSVHRDSSSCTHTQSDLKTDAYQSQATVDCMWNLQVAHCHWRNHPGHRSIRIRDANNHTSSLL